MDLGKLLAGNVPEPSEEDDLEQLAEEVRTAKNAKDAAAALKQFIRLASKKTED